MNKFEVRICNFKDCIRMTTRIYLKNKRLEYESTFQIDEILRNYLESKEELLKGRATCFLEFPIDKRLSKLYLSHHINSMSLIDKDIDKKLLSNEDIDELVFICDLIKTNYTFLN